jgi:hypothetical protein
LCTIYFTLTAGQIKYAPTSKVTSTPCFQHYTKRIVFSASSKTTATREYSLPCIVGTRQATALMRSKTLLRISADLPAKSTTSTRAKDKIPRGSDSLIGSVKAI